VSLTGYDVDGEARPGQPLRVALHWHFAAPQRENVAGYRVWFDLVDEDGRWWPASDDVLAYRPLEWDVGSRAVSWHALGLPGDAPLGAYRLAVRLADGESGAPVSDSAMLSSSETVAHAPEEPLAIFGESLRLLAAEMRLESTVGGERVVVELLLDTAAPLPVPRAAGCSPLTPGGQTSRCAMSTASPLRSPVLGSLTDWPWDSTTGAQESGCRSAAPMEPDCRMIRFSWGCRGRCRGARGAREWGSGGVGE
jgi:hypothetical protein